MADEKKLNEKELEKVNGGLYRRLPTTGEVKPASDGMNSSAVAPASAPPLPAENLEY